MATLIKIDRNGSKHWQGMVECPKCGGIGLIAHHVENGVPSWNWTDGGVCWKCQGTGKVMDKWIERTPEYQAKLDARREARQKAKQAEMDAKRAELERIRQEKEAERIAEEARIKAEKAISQHVGEIKQRMTINATYIRSAWFEVKAFCGYGTETKYIHTFKDADGNVLIWKTGSPLDRNIIDEGDLVELTGTVKEHSEYKDEKQTVLTRCKVKAMTKEEA